MDIMQKTKSPFPDRLQHFIEAMDRDGSGVRFRDVVKEVSNVPGAGADTTSIGIRAVLYQIATHPDTYPRIQKVVDTFYKMELSSGAELNYTQCKTLPYLQAVVKEACGLHPRVSPFAGHVIPPRLEWSGLAPNMNRS